MSERYAMVQDNQTVNVILWDGEAELDLGPDITLIPEDQAPPMGQTVDLPPGLCVDAWSFPADGQVHSVARYGTDEPVWVVVNGAPTLHEPSGSVVVISLSAVEPGVCRIDVRDQSATIIAEQAPSP